MKFTNHRRHYMRAPQIVIIIGPVQICRHTTDKVISILTFIIFAHFQPGDLSDRIAFIGALERPGEQCIFRYRLWCQLRINTRTAEKQQFLHMMIVTAFDNIALYLHIFIGKICRRRIIGIDTSHFCSRQYHHVRFLFFKKVSDLCLLCQFQLFMGSTDDILVSLPFQSPYNGTSYQPSVAGYIDFI